MLKDDAEGAVWPRRSGDQFWVCLKGLWDEDQREQQAKEALEIAIKLMILLSFHRVPCELLPLIKDR